MYFYTYAYLREDKTPYYIGKGEKNRIYKKGKGEIKPPKDKSRIIFLKKNLTEEEAFKHEIYMIAVFGRKDLGTGILRNRTNGGEGASGTIVSEETKVKIGAAHKGKTTSPETRAKLSAANKGKILSPETKAKLSAAKKGENNPLYGKTHSPETKAKMSDALKGENNPLYGKTLSPEHKAKMSASKKGENHPYYGKTHSPETRAKMSAAMKGKTHSPETRAKMSTSKKNIIWINDGNINHRIPKTDIIPEGFVKGRTLKKPTLDLSTRSPEGL
jgi:group I intron endonuclease